MKNTRRSQDSWVLSVILHKLPIEALLRPLRLSFCTSRSELHPISFDLQAEKGNTSVPGEYSESQGHPEDDKGAGSRLPEDLLKESCLPVHWFVNVSEAFDKDKAF